MRFLGALSIGRAGEREGPPLEQSVMEIGGGGRTPAGAAVDALKIPDAPGRAIRSFLDGGCTATEGAL